MRSIVLAAGAVLAVLCLPAAALGQDCVGPAGDPAPGTPAYEQREADNVACGGQHQADLAASPAYQAALAAQLAGPEASRLQDPLRAPSLHRGRRFRSEELSFRAARGVVRAATIFRPCDGSCVDRPTGVDAAAPPYPAVVVVHGGGATQEMYLWASEVLAEAGYLVLTFQTTDAHTEDLRSALDFLLSTPAQPTAAGDVFPHADEVDRAHVGVAGHSAGGVAVSRVGQRTRASRRSSRGTARSPPRCPQTSRSTRRRCS